MVINEILGGKTIFHLKLVQAFCFRAPWKLYVKRKTKVTIDKKQKSGVMSVHRLVPFPLVVAHMRVQKLPPLESDGSDKIRIMKNCSNKVF